MNTKEDCIEQNNDKETSELKIKTESRQYASNPDELSHKNTTTKKRVIVKKEYIYIKHIKENEYFSKNKKRSWQKIKKTYDNKENNNHKLLDNCNIYQEDIVSYDKKNIGSHIIQLDFESVDNCLIVIEKNNYN